ncbi:hypothetical protein D1872_335520 [compost metagenome]
MPEGFVPTIFSLNVPLVPSMVIGIALPSILDLLAKSRILVPLKLKVIVEPAVLLYVRVEL